MIRKSVGSVVVLAVMLGVPETGSAQMPSWQDVQVADIVGMKDKWIGMAGAFEESQYDWEPMEGVRSVRQVLGLAIAEANLFPTSWGFEPGPSSASGFGPELERAAALSQEDMVAGLEASFDYLIEVVAGMDDDKRMSESVYFGRDMPVHANIATAMADMHEHLGQIIAYARTNHVVPPWSMGN